MNSLITIGNYKNTAYSFINGTRVVTLSGLDFTLDLSKIKLFANQTQNKMYGAKSYWNGNTMTQSVPSTTCTAGTATSGGAITAGAHQYKITFVYATGDESLASAASNSITTGSPNFTIPLTAIPTGNANVVARNIYRTAAAGSTYSYLAQIADNTTTTYSDIIADASLGVNEPILSGAYDITLSGTYAVLATNDILDIECEISNSTEDDDLGVYKNINLDSSELPPADTEVSTATDTNLAVGLYFYELPQGPWRNFISQLKATCSTLPSVIRIYATLDPAAVVPATNGTPSVDWSDITNTIYGTNSIVVPTSGTLVLPIRNWAVDDGFMPMMYDRYLLSYQVLNAANFINLNCRKF
jgi:hypothetical protein